MKKESIWLGIIAISLLAACNQNTSESSTSKTGSGKLQQGPCKITAEDSAFICGWNSFPNDKGAISTFDVPVPATLADECVTEYERVFGTTPGFTSAVLFNTNEVKDWTVRSGAFGSGSRLFVLQLGIYTQHVIDSLNNDQDPTNDVAQDKLNRVTIFMSPYQTFTSSVQTRAVNSTGQTINPFNLGSLNP